jgi:MSHA biogenesis protein MshQ
MRAAVKRAAAMVVLLPLGMSGAAVADTVTASPAACTSVTGIGTQPWTNPGSAVSSNGSYATASVNDGQTTNYLQCVGYGFTIPANATINGITVSIERRSSNTDTQDAAMRIVKAGVIGTADRSTATAYTTTDTYEAHGGATDLWGTTWTPADINDANFGAAFASRKPGTAGGARTVSVDHVQITVDYSIPFSCTPPSNTPPGVSLACVCDTFARASLNPSTIFGANWIVSTSDGTGIVPSIVNSGYLRLTNNTGNNAKAATVPGIFPAAGNYISVEFRQFAYNGSGADGIAVTLSDYAVPAVPGAFGGSLGYAQRTGVVGFAGGWIGVALDEYGNYQNPTEGRLGGPGFIPQSVGVRGSGSGMSGYNFLAGTAGLAPLIDNRASTIPSFGYYYQVIVDARNEPASTAVAVNRDTGAGYTSLISVPNIYAAASAQGFTQAPVPANWQISFTGSTGGSTNIHEISGLRICAQTVAPPSGGTAGGFNAIDEAYAIPPATPAVQNFLNGHIYMKLAGVPFKLWVAALSNNQILTTYAAGSSKNVTVKLVDNSDGICVLDSAQPGYCSSACTSKSAVTGGSQTLTFVSTDSGKKQSANFTLNTAYKNLAAIISDGTTTACSTDAFSVRPASISSVVSSNATNAGTSGTPVFKAGGDRFSLTATTAGIAGNPSGYTGVLKINNATVQAVSPATVVGAVAGTFPAATSAIPSSTATGSTFTYSEVGAFQLPGYDPATDATSPRGVFDGVATPTECTTPGLTVAQCDTLRAATWTGIDSISSKGDCVLDSYSNTKDASGKYGCSFGNTATTAAFGRFIPDHFALAGATTLTNRSDIAACSGSTFTYLGEPFRLGYTLRAENAGNNLTQNYTGVLAKLNLTSAAAMGYGAVSATTNLTSRVDTSGAHSGTWSAGQGAVNATLAISRAVAPDGPFANTYIGIAPTDSDGVAYRGSGFDIDVDNSGGNDHARIGTTEFRFGRLKLGNAHGSETLDLPMPTEVQYWSSLGFVLNGADNCTTLAGGAAGNINLGNWQKNLSSAEMDKGHVVMTNPFSGGRGNLRLARPSGGDGIFNGSADVTVDLAAEGKTYLQGAWAAGSPYTMNPTARATFGVFKNANEFIFMRENY